MLAKPLMRLASHAQARVYCLEDQTTGLTPHSEGIVYTGVPQIQCARYQYKAFIERL